MAETCYQMNDTLTLTEVASWDIEGILHTLGMDAPVASIAVEEGNGVYALAAVFEMGGQQYPAVLYQNGSWTNLPSAPELCVTGGADANDPGFLAFMQANSTGGGGGDDEGINVCADPRDAMIVPIPDGSLMAGETEKGGSQESYGTTYSQAYEAFGNGTPVFISFVGDNGTIISPVTGISYDADNDDYIVTYIDGATGSIGNVNGSGNDVITLVEPPREAAIDWQDITIERRQTYSITDYQWVPVVGETYDAHFTSTRAESTPQGDVQLVAVIADPEYPNYIDLQAAESPGWRVEFAVTGETRADVSFYGGKSTGETFSLIVYKNEE